MHPMVHGEIALGSLSGRGEVLRLLAALPRAVVAEEAEVRHLIEAGPLHGRGIGYVDSCLLASVRLTPGARLWTRDRRLQLAAKSLDVSL